MTRNIGEPPHRRPVVGVPCDVKMLGPHPFHAVGEKYITAVAKGADCLPILIPVPPDPVDHDEIFAMCDGIFLTGSWSNVHPDTYGGPPARDGTLHDHQRDALTLPLIRATLARHMPLFCVCRGFQEMNVAFGGTLHPHLEDAPAPPGYAPRLDHRENKDAPLAEQYGPAHDIQITPGGQLDRIIGAPAIQVNSLHGQGVDRVGDGLSVEARAPDGTIEALSVTQAESFALAVQWHPEWQFQENPVSLNLFRAFGDAVRTHARHRNRLTMSKNR